MLLKWGLAFIAFTFAFSVKASVSLVENHQQIEKIQLTDEAVIALRTNKAIRDLNELRNEEDYKDLFRELEGSELKLILSRQNSNQFRTLIQWKAKSSSELRQTANRLSESEQIEWIRPNYQYEGEARDVQFQKDPRFHEQIHHQIMQSSLAWMFTEGSAEIIVAVTDDGVDIDHEDLKDNIWVNTKEIPGNGIDDDNNGYIDDINGWDFSSGDNDPRPFSSFWGGSHGTHVAGIIAAVGNNGVGVVGSAPKVKIMPIRFYGSSAWTSSVVAESFAYAVNNGARIISTSYNIDSMVDDPIFQEAVQFVYENNVLYFNSAGNSYEKNPKRQKLDEAIFVCSTSVDPEGRDQKSDFSNWGSGIDICAPGSNILSTIPSNKYAEMSGTSMAAPNAAAVAALIWSLNPSWTKEQVVAQLYSGAEDIDLINPLYAGGFGAGRVNSFRSLAFQARPPQIASAELVRKRGLVSGIKIRLKSIFKAESIHDSRNWVLSSSEGQKYNLKVDRPYKIGTNEFILLLEESLPNGSYQLRARADGLKDPFDRALDGDLNGIPGGDFIFNFEVSALESDPKSTQVEDHLSESQLHAKAGL